MNGNSAPAADRQPPAPTVKCLVWDLDRTVWEGVLLEDGPTPLRPGVRETIAELDRRGILQSIASRNDPEHAAAELRRHGIAEFFLQSRIGWNAKSSSVRGIAAALNLGLDAFAFVDDDPFERDEVAHVLPQVRCYDAADAARLPGLPEFTPRHVTDDSARRRAMYQADQRRAEVEQEFEGSQEVFLRTLGMVLTVTPAQEEDLRRAEELTVRTHQLNTTGRTYSYDDLRDLIRSPAHELLVARLDDRYGTYGTIGLVLTERTDDAWCVKLLLMSCRVMSRGVGGALITLLRRRAAEAGVSLRADFVPTGRNRMMYVTYRLAGFREVRRGPKSVLLECAPDRIPPLPAYLDLRLLDAPEPVQ
jgi:FkbH-like protein